MAEKLYSVEEAAELLPYTPGTVKNMCAAGKIPAQKVGKTWVIQESELNQFMLNLKEEKQND